MKVIHLMLLFISVLPASIMAVEELTNDEKKKLFNYRYNELPSPLVTYDSILKLTVENELRSVDELLPKLPHEYRRFYTRVYASKSLQGASFESPRIIIYGPDAQTIITVTGNSKFKNGEVVEMIEWNDDESRFSFREIKFPGTHLPGSVHFNPNPTNCVGCHQIDSRPNWDAYRFWRGVYGSRGAGGMDEIAKGSIEHEQWQNFVKNASQKQRYRFLPTITNFSERTLNIMQKRIPKSLVPANGAVTDPNIFFNQQVAELNRRRIARMMKESSNFSIFKYAILYSDICIPSHDNEKAEELIKSAMSKRWIDKKDSYPKILKRYSETAEYERRQRYSEIEILNPKPNEDRPEENYSGMNFVGLPDSQKRRAASFYYLLSNLEIDYSPWSMVFGLGQYDFASGINDNFPHSRSIFLALRDLPEMRVFLDPQDMKDLEMGGEIYTFRESNEERCRALALKSRTSMDN